jgi:glycosyltransferase involved in cell wall biosynthesis
MKDPLVSVLIAVHNEEKVIARTLSNLIRIRDREYRNMEIIVGSDGNEDRTDEIVRKFRSVKLLTANQRLGKAGMLKRMYKVAKGEIIIIHDADWLLDSRGKFKNIVKYFEDPKVGGLNNCRVPPTKEIHPLCLGEAYTYVLLREFNKTRNAECIDGRMFEKKDSTFPFMVDTFRRSAMPSHQLTLCDDGERSIQLRKNGYLVAIGGSDVPNFIVDYDNPQKVGQIIKHSVRTSVARKQVKEIYGQMSAGYLNFYMPAFFYSIRKTLFTKLGFYVAAFWILNLISAIKARGVSFSTEEGWKIRYR